MTLSPRSPDLIAELDRLTASEFDLLEFGVIGFDQDELVTVYNRYEAETAGLSPERVIGGNLFTAVAPCTNNYLVAERFRQEATLDEELDYVFTLRMRPTPVRLRLLVAPTALRRYMIVMRAPSELGGPNQAASDRE